MSFQYLRMKLGTVNVRSGGNPASVLELSKIMRAAGCSTIVFSEFRDNLAGKALLRDLQGHGYRYFAFSSDVRGVLVVSQQGFDATVNPGGLATFPNAMIRANFATWTLYAVYMPTGKRKIPQFRYLIEAAKQHNARREAGIAIGDFNNGCEKLDIQVNVTSGKRIEDFPAHPYFHEFDEVWPEAWRRLHPSTHEYSWFASNKPISQRQGWRLDEAFVSPLLLPDLASAEYLPQTRVGGWTDHSALVVTLGA
ncbi:MAG: hypothetical protein JOY87_00080 [Candidatus Eremiobacteraeota bacterium]|nr:hypothetical protein [Candidatus Eremiobacteraeota bacterium]